MQHLEVFENAINIHVTDRRLHWNVIEDSSKIVKALLFTKIF